MTEIEERLQQSVKLLRAWGWMSTLSNRPDEAIKVLTGEARELVRLGTQHPKRVREIGRLIVAYERLITSLKDPSARRQASAEESRKCHIGD
jgi:hypothetical protein